MKASSRRRGYASKDWSEGCSKPTTWRRRSIFYCPSPPPSRSNSKGLARLFYLGCAAVMTIGVLVTLSRGDFWG